MLNSDKFLPMDFYWVIIQTYHYVYTILRYVYLPFSIQYKNLRFYHLVQVSVIHTIVASLSSVVQEIYLSMIGRYQV